MSVASRTLGSVLPTATSPFALLYHGMARVVATVAFWCRRAHDRRQLAVMLSRSSLGFHHDTGLLCTEADLWLREWALKNRRRESNDQRDRWRSPNIGEIRD